MIRPIVEAVSRVDSNFMPNRNTQANSSNTTVSPNTHFAGDLLAFLLRPFTLAAQLLPSDLVKQNPGCDGDVQRFHLSQHRNLKVVFTL